MSGVVLTPSQVNKAGKVARYYVTGRIGPEEWDKVEHAIQVISAFRAAHQAPLTAANMGLRSLVKTERCVEPEISQRLKRFRTIVNKLMRKPTMALSTLQDVGGCRAVLSSVDEVYRVRDRLRRNGKVVGEDDYIRSPKVDGYRGVHVIVRYHERQIEIQLRTQVMHEWALFVEQLASVVGEDVKTGGGPEPVRSLMEAISRAMAVEERGDVVDDVLRSEIDHLRSSARPFLGRV